MKRLTLAIAPFLAGMILMLSTPALRAEDHPLEVLRFGYLDQKGKLIIIPQFEKAEGFYNGCAVVKIGDGFGFINENGVVVIPPLFDQASHFADGRAAVKFGPNWGYIDTAGRWVAK